MTQPKRVYVCFTAIALTVAGSLATSTDIAQTFSAQQHVRAPRQRPDATTFTVPRPGTNFGDPLGGLSTDEAADFADGLEEFSSEDTAASGLGPIFNNVSCVACHSTPAAGGVSTIFVTRFGRTVNGQFDPLTELGGSLLQEKAIDPAVQEVIPSQANVIAHRMTTPLFGAGLIEAIPDAEILLNAAVPKPDGISGRPSVVQDVASGQTRIGRFGWKAQQATLLSFAGDAYLNEMGITNRLFPTENAPNGNTALLAQYDLVPDPEDVTDPATGKADIDRFADFMRMLAPPPQLALTQDARAGQDLFSQIGCAACHRPMMVTGPNTSRALDRKAVPLFSDLLLHDMGSLGDGIAQGSARPSEMRTAPLWGLRSRGPYLHDGRAATVDAAIRMHDGEAARARDRFNRLGKSMQAQLLAYLGSI
ncbi:MAG TPA: di-heme oxidoredictase family protein [Casimicrobiaceae bacterium]|nr:di-heme oxidoredictase family protein [Casimicrobiaceae bacterium]